MANNNRPRRIGMIVSNSLAGYASLINTPNAEDLTVNPVSPDDERIIGVGLGSGPDRTIMSVVGHAGISDILAMDEVRIALHEAPQMVLPPDVLETAKAKRRAQEAGMERGYQNARAEYWASIEKKKSKDWGSKAERIRAGKR